MFKYHHGVGIVLFLIVGSWFGCTKNPLATNGGDPGVTVGFNVTGKILGKDGKGIAGARATLLESGLSAVTDAQGVYSIVGQGTLHKALAKSLASDSTDTLVVLVPNEQGSSDSSEVIKQVVTSGIIMELPSTYIVQREIRGYLLPDDAKQISKIEAVLFDVAVPEQQKHIDLWHDTLNKAFHSFAYFSSATNKSYTLYINVYDTANHLVGRSPDFTFPDQAGNIVFANAFSWSNAKPTIEVIAPVAVATGTDSVSITVTATDNLGGKIVSCKIYTNATNSITVQRNGTLAKRASNDSVDVFVGTVKIPVVSGAVAVVIDNDGNILKGDIMVDIVEPQISVDFLAYKNGLPMSVLTVGDTVELRSSSYFAPVVDFTITKVQWFYDNAVIGDTETIKYIIPKTPAGQCTLSVKVESNLGKTATSAKMFNVSFGSASTTPDMIKNMDGTFSCTNLPSIAPIQKIEYEFDTTGVWTACNNTFPVTIVTPTGTTNGAHKITFKITARDGKDYLSLPMSYDVTNGVIVPVVPVVPVVHPVVPDGSKPIMERDGLTFTCTNVSVFAPVTKAAYEIGFNTPVAFDINSPVTLVVPPNTPSGTPINFLIYLDDGKFFYSTDTL